MNNKNTTKKILDIRLDFWYNHEMIKVGDLIRITDKSKLIIIKYHFHRGMCTRRDLATARVACSAGPACAPRLCCMRNTPGERHPYGMSHAKPRSVRPFLFSTSTSAAAVFKRCHCVVFLILSGSQPTPNSWSHLIVRMKCRRHIHTDGCTSNPPSCMHSAILSCNDLRCDWLKMRRNEHNPEALIAKRLQATLKTITCDEHIRFANLQGKVINHYIVALSAKYARPSLLLLYVRDAIGLWRYLPNTLCLKVYF